MRDKIISTARKIRRNVSLDSDLDAEMTKLNKYGVKWSVVINSDLWKHVKDAREDLQNIKTPGYKPKFLEFLRE